MIQDTHSAQISPKQDERNIYIYIYEYVYSYIYVIMKTMCPPGYHHNSFLATHALVHIMYSYTLLVPMNQRVLKKPPKESNESGNK